MKTFNNAFFKNMNAGDIADWISQNNKQLVGSAIFTRNNSITSKLVQWAEKRHCKDKSFIPSHTGSIISYRDKICIFDMKPPKASITPLFTYLRHTDDDFVIILRDFLLDVNMFSTNIAEHLGELYPYMSAIRSAFTKLPSKWRRHCSELHLRELQKQSIYTKVNPEITPDELYHIMAGEG